MDNRKKVLVAARKISFLMPHQEVLPDLKEIAATIYQGDTGLDRNSPEYMLGAFEALTALIEGLEQKGPKTK